MPIRLPTLAPGRSYEIVIDNVRRLLSADVTLADARRLVLSRAGLLEIPRVPVRRGRTGTDYAVH